MRDLHAGDLQEFVDVIAAAAADASHADADRLVGAQHLARRLGAGDGERGGDAGAAALDEGTCVAKGVS